MAAKKVKVCNVPNLRFPEFEEEGNSYRKHSFKDIFLFSTGKNIKQSEASPEYETPCVRYGELYHMYNEVITEVINKTNLDKSELLFSQGDEILLPSAGEDPLDIGSASALTVKNVAIGRTINILKPAKENVYSHSYVSYYINQKLKKIISTLAKGVSISNVYNSDLRTLKITLPSVQEQHKIALFLSLVDERIKSQNKIIKGLMSFKNMLRNCLFDQIMEGGYDIFLIKSLLAFEQPTKYLVSNTDYSNDVSLMPVLTANKSFILGYTNEKVGIYNKGECVIFDDFTMDIKYVNFPFKVKSSAIKILTGRSNVNLKFMFEYLAYLNLSSTEHKRHYISEIELMQIFLPDAAKQSKIANLLSDLDKKINIESEICNLFIKQKRHLLSNLFI